MITLPNGCSCSNLSVYPKNWQSKNAKVNKNWYIDFTTPDTQNQTGNGKEDEPVQNSTRKTGRNQELFEGRIRQAG